jgi:hypothetical protein
MFASSGSNASTPADFLLKSKIPSAGHDLVSTLKKNFFLRLYSVRLCGLHYKTIMIVSDDHK